MPAQFVTLAQAKAFLRIPTPPGHVDDPDVQFALDAAEAAVVRFVSRSPVGLAVVAGWIDDADCPADAKWAIAYQCGELYRFRGDDPGSIIYSPGREVGHDLHPIVVGLLRRFGDPVLA